ncbi:MAG TPA: pseudouridine synthase, partial [Afipia sp.]
RGPSRDGDSRPPRREGAGGFDKSRFDRGERDSSERPRFSRPRFDKPRDDRAPRGRSDWQEHPRSETSDRPRRENEDDSKVFAKRPAFGGRGEYRERKPDFDKRAPRAAPEKKKSGERIAKIVARAGLCSRRDAEDWIVQGRVAVNGRVINSPALDVTANDVVTIDGKPLPERERTRLFLYHKPRGLMTTHDDPEGRPTVFDNLPEGLPRLISIGRLDFNTEGLLLLTNDGGLARALELPDTGWLRRYRVRAHGEVTQAQLDQLKNGVEVDGVKYGSIDATLERDKAANVWIVFAIREGKNREVRNVMAHLGLEVNRLIRISYGPFQLGEIEEGQVDEIKSRVLREQLGEKIVAMSGAQFDKPVKERTDDDDAPQAKEGTKERIKGRIKPAGTKSGLIADRKGRRILVTRAGSDEARARNEEEANGYGPPRRPTRGYKGKRDLKPRDDVTED